MGKKLSAGQGENSCKRPAFENMERKKIKNPRKKGRSPYRGETWEAPWKRVCYCKNTKKSEERGEADQKLRTSERKKRLYESDTHLRDLQFASQKKLGLEKGEPGLHKRHFVLKRKRC